MYIAFEGVDCVGKSTQIELLKKCFKDAIFTKEPGGSELGVHLRKILLESKMQFSKKAELLLFLADRANLIDIHLVQNKNKLIISDRSFVSNMAYAKFDFDQNILFDLNSFATGGFFPQKIVFLHGSKELIEQRLSKKNLDSIEKRGVEYFLNIQNALEETLEILKTKIDIKILKLDASLSIENLHEKIKEFIND
ncbi:TPA: dTMP kinase [Campylobacter lari]|uniref:Thymidylate kinase n=2 Tax=Campylobacter lari TaxID=201 RepID=KTHY_CAMLR|nr:dTMP kinase [Campylobacter lari]B9KG87.1 RecName: Full=Thymidylate kinase; AltName: Full=dTMP kinase [Campylobacter lari RM2100]ACM64072.1 dTMP kinase [Campylobacter lari RM2100]EAC1839416.1 dTMP kinase [Campylobacter lari]EAH7779951.1 dTMP kinase [Campylobacter lari]EAH8152110.1 dTMP kinase [Campylobacter lari]EAH8419453.1 dTMP kinase [Campylobacter lari]